MRDYAPSAAAMDLLPIFPSAEVNGLDKIRQVAKYSEDQPRDDEGRFASGGGRSVAQAEGERPVRLPADVPDYGRGHTIVRSDQGLWGSSHGASRDITGEAAKAMGLDGYRAEPNPSEDVKGAAGAFLGAIADDRLGSEEVLYHGFANVAGTEFHEGDTLTLPTTATAGDPTTVGYGMRLDPRDQEGQPTLFAFAPGTPMAGYSRNTKGDIEEDREYNAQWRADPTASHHSFYGTSDIWSEAIVAGRFRVSGTSTIPYQGHDVKVVSLVPTETFDPKSGSWSPTDTRLLDPSWSSGLTAGTGVGRG